MEWGVGLELHALHQLQSLVDLACFGDGYGAVQLHDLGAGWGGSLLYIGGLSGASSGEGGAGGHPFGQGEGPSRWDVSNLEQRGSNTQS